MRLKTIFFLFCFSLSLNGSSQALIFETLGSVPYSIFGSDIKSSTSGDLFGVSQIEESTASIFLYKRLADGSYFEFKTLIFNNFSGKKLAFSFDISGDGSTLVCCYETLDEELLCGKYQIDNNAINLESSHQISDYQSISIASNKTVLIEIDNSCELIILAYNFGIFDKKYFEYDMSDQLWSGKEIYSGGSNTSGGHFIDIAKNNNLMILAAQSKNSEVGSNELIGLKLDNNCQSNVSFEMFDTEYIRDVGISSDGSHFVNLDYQFGLDGVFDDHVKLNVFAFENDQPSNIFSTKVRLVHPTDNDIYNYAKISDQGDVLVCGASFIGNSSISSFGHSKVYLYKKSSLGPSYQLVDSINVNTRLNTLDLTADGRTLFVGEFSYYEYKGRVSVYDISPTVSVDDPSIDNDITIYPNPADQYLTIQSTHHIYSDYSIINTLGQTLLRGKADGIETNVDINKFENGMYFVIIGKENSQIKPFIIHR